MQLDIALTRLSNVDMRLIIHSATCISCAHLIHAKNDCPQRPSCMKLAWFRSHRCKDCWRIRLPDQVTAVHPCCKMEGEALSEVEASKNKRKDLVKKSSRRRRRRNSLQLPKGVRVRYSVCCKLRIFLHKNVSI